MKYLYILLVIRTSFSSRDFMKCSYPFFANSDFDAGAYSADKVVYAVLRNKPDEFSLHDCLLFRIAEFDKEESEPIYHGSFVGSLAHILNLDVET